MIFDFPYSRLSIYLALVAISYMIRTPSQAMLLIDTVVCAILYTYDTRDITHKRKRK
jgi:hypothetical protein